jgi:hypothetical protein
MLGLGQGRQKFGSFVAKGRQANEPVQLKSDSRPNTAPEQLGGRRLPTLLVQPGRGLGSKVEELAGRTRLGSRASTESQPDDDVSVSPLVIRQEAPDWSALMNRRAPKNDMASSLFAENAAAIEIMEKANRLANTNTHGNQYQVSCSMMKYDG